MYLIGSKYSSNHSSYQLFDISATDFSPLCGTFFNIKAIEGVSEKLDFLTRKGSSNHVIQFVYSLCLRWWPFASTHAHMNIQRVILLGLWLLVDAVPLFDQSVFRLVDIMDTTATEMLLEREPSWTEPLTQWISNHRCVYAWNPILEPQGRVHVSHRKSELTTSLWRCLELAGLVLVELLPFSVHLVTVSARWMPGYPVWCQQKLYFRNDWIKTELYCALLKCKCVGGYGMDGLWHVLAELTGWCHYWALEVSYDCFV